MPECGGCRGLGSHRRWCTALVGPVASHYGRMAETAESLGDACGDPETANHLWAAAGRLRARAERYAATHRLRTERATM